jgi:hypothetical protein
MKFGTKVKVLRGSNNTPREQRYYARGKIVGARDCMVAVRLTRDDEHATQAPEKRNEIGWFGRRSVVKG